MRIPSRGKAKRRPGSAAVGVHYAAMPETPQPPSSAEPPQSSPPRTPPRPQFTNVDTRMLRELGEILGELAMAEGTRRSKLWEDARMLLAPIARQDERVAKILSLRSVDGLGRLLRDLHASAKAAPPGAAPPAVSTTPQAPAPAPTYAPPQPPTPAQLKSAMKLFRKRLKLTRLDDESRLGRSNNPMTGGRQSQVMAIMAPREFPKPVWDELVRQGKLRTRDGSFYELADE